MPRRSVLALLLTVGAATGACGGRTGLGGADPGAGSLGDGAPADADVEGATDDAAPPVGGGDYPYCDVTKGPLPASAVPDGSFTLRCSAQFPHCVDIGGQWLCCNGPGPYDGPGGSCTL